MTADPTSAKRAVAAVLTSDCFGRKRNRKRRNSAEAALLSGRLDTLEADPDYSDGALAAVQSDVDARRKPTQMQPSQAKRQPAANADTALSGRWSARSPRHPERNRRRRW